MFFAVWTTKNFTDCSACLNKAYMTLSIKAFYGILGETSETKLILQCNNCDRVEESHVHLEVHHSQLRQTVHIRTQDFMLPDLQRLSAPVKRERRRVRKQFIHVPGFTIVLLFGPRAEHLIWFSTIRDKPNFIKWKKTYLLI